METTIGLSNLKNPAYTSKYAPFHPFSLPLDSSSIEPKENFKYGENMNYHHRCSSDSFLFDEQPSWLEDLLKDPGSPFQRSHHQRSASDSFAYLEEAEDSITECDESTNGFTYFRALAESRNLFNYKDLGHPAVERKDSEMVSALDLEHRRDESSLENLEGSADKDARCQAKHAGQKSDPKRKQHNAHRSRVRKLQYIAHLEKTVEMLKVEGSGISAELEFLEQQNMILTMENRALRQRLESVSQEQLIKQWEQSMLEREIARLQTLYHLQKQQQQQMHMQQHQQTKQRGNKSRDLDHQANIFSMKKNEASSSKSSVNGSAQA